MKIRDLLTNIDYELINNKTGYMFKNEFNNAIILEPEAVEFIDN